MKEAAGEANLTVVAIILIAVIVAVATPLINSLMRSSTVRACCTDQGGVWHGSACWRAHNDHTMQYSREAGVACCQDALPNYGGCEARFNEGARQ